MDSFSIYVSLIFIVKIIFIFLAITLLYTTRQTPKNEKLIGSLKLWKGKVEFIFKIMMSIMLIYVFNPRSNNIRLINREAKILLCLFGFILIITADWSTFTVESKIFEKIQNILGSKKTNLKK
jgi:hypothetical protein